MKLSIDVALYVTVEKTKDKTHSYGLYLARECLYIKSFRIKPTGIIILYRILTVTYYRIDVNYKILTVTGLYRY